MPNYGPISSVVVFGSMMAEISCAVILLSAWKMSVASSYFWTRVGIQAIQGVQHQSLSYDHITKFSSTSMFPRVRATTDANFSCFGTFCSLKHLDNNSLHYLAQTEGNFMALKTQTKSASSPWRLNLISSITNIWFNIRLFGPYSTLFNSSLIQAEVSLFLYP